MISLADLWTQVTADFNDPFAPLPVGTSLVRILFALILGGIIGIDRELRTKPAGLRTHMLVSTAACVFALLGVDMLTFGAQSDSDIQIDPMRLIEAVTAGVAFLAAGSIITSGGQVRGLTTGAGMWMAGAVGLACGIGNLPLACLATGAAFVVLSILRAFDPGGGRDGGD